MMTRVAGLIDNRPAVELANTFLSLCDGQVQDDALWALLAATGEVFHLIGPSPAEAADFLCVLLAGAGYGESEMDEILSGAKERFPSMGAMISQSWLGRKQ
jgi:hypothetical protein